MGELLTTGSVLAAFLAGGVALFAPCCIVFLAPSYLAAAVKNRRWRLLPLTFLFAAGLALVLVPITLGIGLVASAVANYHTPLYYAGGALMLFLAPGGKELLTFSDDLAQLETAVAALGVALKREKPASFTLETVDGKAVSQSPLLNALRHAGFSRVPQGFSWYS